jgi:hypothetical protein
MSPSEREALENAHDIVAIANAMLAIKAGDRRRTAVGLLSLIQVLVGDDVIGRVALATLLCEASAELLSSIPLEQLNDTVNVRWWN